MSEFTSVSDQKPASRKRVLVRFEWGEGLAHVARYAAFDSDVIVASATYLAEPALDVQPGQLHGGIEDKPWTIIGTTSMQPLANLIRPYEHAPVIATIYEVDVDSHASRIVFSGNVTKTTQNKSGLKRLVSVEVSGWKSLIQYPGGLPILAECPWVLGDKNCCVDLAPTEQHVDVDAILAPTVIRAEGLVIPGDDTRFFDFGEVYYDGLSIGIKIARHANDIQLNRSPPPEWVGSTVRFRGGCDKTIGTCRSRWDNESRFAGAGIDMPDYNPLIGSS